MVFSSGSKDIDNFLKGGFPTDQAVVIYGEPASGKTTIAFQASLTMAMKNKKVFFVDVEQSFSLDRLRQLVSDCDKYLDNIKLFSPKSFDEQEKVILSLPFNCGLVVIDSLSKFYREAVKDEPNLSNERLITQLRRLHKFIDKGIPVIITNQVYSTLDGQIKVVGGDMIRRWSQYLIKLRKNPRTMFFEKPEFKEFKFKIASEGIIGI